MTVKELINLLEKMPKNAKVAYYDGDNGWTTPEVEYLSNAPLNYYNQKEKIGALVSLTGYQWAF